MVTGEARQGDNGFTPSLSGTRCGLTLQCSSLIWLRSWARCSVRGECPFASKYSRMGRMSAGMQNSHKLPYLLVVSWACLFRLIQLLSSSSSSS